MQMYKNFIGKIKLFYGIIPLVLLSSMILSSCYKKEPTTLEVAVQFSNGELVKNAKVKLVVEPTTNTNQVSIINDSTTTNSGGLAFFEMDKYYKSGQVGVAVLKVNAFYFGLTGNQVIQIEEEKRNRVVVMIQ
jgi:hypothetical protein